MIFEFDAVAQRDYEENETMLWTKGRTYACVSNDLRRICVETDQRTSVVIEPGSEVKFWDIFATEFRVDIPPEFLSNEARDRIYRKVWAEHVKEDILLRAEEQEIDVDEAKAEELAELYINGQYDCNLSYWDNIDALLPHNILPTAAEGFFERLTAMLWG